MIEIVDTPHLIQHRSIKPSNTEPIAANSLRKGRLGIVTDGQRAGHLVISFDSSRYTVDLTDGSYWCRPEFKVRPLSPADAVTLVVK